MNIATLAQTQAERYGARPLALVNDEPVSYEQLADRAARFAAGLQALGIGQGDRVAVMMPTRPEFLYAWFGILGAGAIEVPIHDAARGPGIAYILETTGVRALVVDEEHVEHVAGQIGKVESLENVIVTGGAPALDKPTTRLRRAAEHARRSPSSASRAIRRRSSSPAARPARPRASCSPTTTTSTWRRAWSTSSATPRTTSCSRSSRSSTRTRST